MHQSSRAGTRRMSRRARVVALATSAAVLASAAVVGGAVSASASNISSAPLDILLGVGTDQTQRIASWYYPGNAAQSLEIEKTADLAAGAFDTDKTVVAASSTANTAADSTLTDSDTKNLAGAANQTGYYSAHAKITGLEPGTSYTYHVGAADGSNWSTTYTFTTPGESSDFDFLFFGDPQIGSSGHVDDDGTGWAETLKYATTRDPQTELLVSGGDQVEHANNEYEWSAFADAKDLTGATNTALKQYPWASTIGNHDVGGKAYEQHNLVPNWMKSPDFYPGQASSTNSGGDYWFMWKDVLFIDINSNAYAGGADAEHVSYITDVINHHGDDAKWKVLIYHHSIYSPADHANDTDNQQRRFDFTTKFSQLGVNLVLQGHDHSYSRSYSILNGKKANPDEEAGQTEVFPGPGGVIYVTANSASGSKYYDLTKPGVNASGAAVDPNGYTADPTDPTGSRHWANSVENQEHVRTYVKVSVTDDALNVDDIRAGTCDVANSAVVNGNLTTCGQTLKPVGSFDPAPVGSFVDQFSLLKSAPAAAVELAASKTSQAYHTTSPVTLTASVSETAGAASGTVGFYDGTRLLSTKTVVDGVAEYDIPTTLAVGSHSFSATFTADASSFVGDATSDATAISVTKAPSTTTVSYSGGKWTVKVVSTGISVGGSVHIYDGSKMLKTLTLSNGVATYTKTLAKGSHTIKATYAGTTSVGASTSKSVSVKVS